MSNIALSFFFEKKVVKSCLHVASIGFHFDDIDEMQMVGRFESCVCGSVGGKYIEGGVVDVCIYIFLQPAAAGSIDRFRRRAAGQAGFFLFFGESRHPPLPTTRRNLRHQRRRGGGESQRGNIYPTPKEEEKKRGELSTRVKEKRTVCICMNVCSTTLLFSLSLLLSLALFFPSPSCFVC